MNGLHIYYGLTIKAISLGFPKSVYHNITRNLVTYNL